MIKLRVAQTLALRQAMTRKQVKEVADDIYIRISEATPEATSDYSYDDAISVIIKVVEVTTKYGVVDIADVTQWSYLRLITKEDFYDRPAFKYFLDDPLIHPARKGKAIVEGYILATEMERR